MANIEKYGLDPVQYVKDIWVRIGLSPNHFKVEVGGGCEGDPIISIDEWIEVRECDNVEIHTLDGTHYRKGFEVDVASYIHATRYEPDNVDVDVDSKYLSLHHALQRAVRIAVEHDIAQAIECVEEIRYQEDLRAGRLEEY